MDSGKTMGTQLMDVLSWTGFARLVARYGGHAKVHLRRAVPGHALSAVDLTRDHAGHRGMPGSESLSPVCHGFLPACAAFDLSRCQREPRLAHQGRSRRGPHSASTQALLRRGSRARSRPHRLRARCHDHRPVPLAVRLGLVSDNQGRHKDPHAAGSQGFYPCLHLHQRQKDVRCPDSGSDSHWGWCILYDGPWPPGFPTVVRRLPERRALFYPGQARGGRPSCLTDADGSGPGCHQRPAGGPQLVRCIPAISLLRHKDAMIEKCRCSSRTTPHCRLGRSPRSTSCYKSCRSPFSRKSSPSGPLRRREVGFKVTPFLIDCHSFTL